MKRLLRKGIVFMMAALMAVMSVPMTAAANGPGSGESVVTVKNIPQGKIGRNMNITFVVNNDTGSAWEDVYVGIEGDYYSMNYPGTVALDGEYVFPFEVNESTFQTKYVGKIEGGKSKSVSLTAKVRADLAEGYYSVPIVIEHNSHKAVERGNVNIWLSKPTGTDNNDAGHQISFTLGENQSTPHATYPQTLNFSINMRNSGLVDARDVNVAMGLSKSTDEFPFDINEGNYDRNFDVIAAGQTVQLPYSLAVRPDAYSGYYPIKFTISYRETATGDLKKEEDTFWVKITNKEKESSFGDFNANNRTKARIVVDSFETIPANIIAGEPFQLRLRMKNASADINASNIMFSMSSEKVNESAVFTTASGSSSVVVNTLEAGAVVELCIDMLSKAGIDQRSYYLKIDETYDSPQFKNATEHVSIDIPIKQVARLNLGTIEVMPNSIKVGSESNVMFQINNTGKVILYNLMAAFEADSIMSTETYVGNIKPGETGNVDVMISGIAPTSDDGKVKVKITYEDENGVVQEPVEKELSLYVYDPMPEDFGDMHMGGMMQMPVEEPSFLQKYLKFIVPAAALLVVGIVSAWIVRKKKKTAEEEGLDDEIS